MRNWERRERMAGNAWPGTQGFRFAIAGMLTMQGGSPALPAYAPPCNCRDVNDAGRKPCAPGIRSSTFPACVPASDPVN